jgi:two-component system, NtrC family, sensor histidine kinase PilS
VGIPVNTWNDSIQLADPTLQSEPAEFRPTEFDRLWRGFMTARVTLGVALVSLEGALWSLSLANDLTLVTVAFFYLLATLVVRLFSRPHEYGQHFSLQWLLTIGVDAIAFSTLQFLQGMNINYAPLFLLPVLMASVLGSKLLAFGTAAGVSLLLLAASTWWAFSRTASTAALFVQAGLLIAGCWLITFLSNQVSARLAEEEYRARLNRRAAQIQRRVNQMVIENLRDGVLVIDDQARVRAANPVARALLVGESAVETSPIHSLKDNPAWDAILVLAMDSFAGSECSGQELDLRHAGRGSQRLLVRTQLTGMAGTDAQNLCVMFLQDQREAEARLRTEKLASMGRMSAAVAHEIRNPLAAIVQANALLEEDLAEPRHVDLVRMIRHNSDRLGKIVDDILNVSRARGSASDSVQRPLELNTITARLTEEWAIQNDATACLESVQQPAGAAHVEHLRRILVNLLDNALRYSSRTPGAILVHSGFDGQQAILSVWSDSPPLEPSVERHLFEPFFSSESRSSGLGLYICRELCEGHGASIRYRRCRRNGDSGPVGNAFQIVFHAMDTPSPVANPQRPVGYSPNERST